MFLLHSLSSHEGVVVVEHCITPTYNASFLNSLFVAWKIDGRTKSRQSVECGRREGETDDPGCMHTYDGMILQQEKPPMLVRRIGSHRNTCFMAHMKESKKELDGACWTVVDFC